ncbi:SpoU-methylase domain-containing protein [Aphelenchoides bicaudatus]|nr:SpoU-methylase domain-containing protein [Aphelenchoides bicaudatus]
MNDDPLLSAFDPNSDEEFKRNFIKQRSRDLGMFSYKMRKLSNRRRASKILQKNFVLSFWTSSRDTFFHAQYFSSVKLCRQRWINSWIRADLPLARRVFTSINKHHFQKLRHACFYNFFALFVQIFKLDDVKELESVFLMLPETVQEQANELLLVEFSKTLERETNLTEQQTTYTENDIPLILNNIQSEDASFLKSVKALIELMTTVDYVKQAEIVKTIEVAYFDSRGESYCFEMCGYYIDAILNNFEPNTADSLERLFKLLELNVKNPNVVYTIARKINNHPNISVAIYPVLLELIVYGELPSKFTDVLKIAHVMARSFNLDEVTELHLLQQRVREFSNVSLLNLAFQNMDTVDNLVSSIVQKMESINQKHRNIPFALSHWHRKQTRILSLLLVFVGKPEFYKCLSNETNEKIRAMCIERIFEENQQYSIKMMCEQLLTFYCIRDPDFYTYWLEQSKELAYKRIGAVASWISSILRSLRVDNELNRQRLPGFLLKVLPWVTAQNFLVNVFSIGAFKLLCNWHRQYINDTPSIQFAIEVGDFNVETTGNTRKFVNSVCADPMFDQLMPEKVDLYVMFYAFPKLTGMPADELIFETKPHNALLEQHGLTDYFKVDFTQPCLFASLNTTVITKPNKSLSRTLEIFNGTALVLSYAGIVDKPEFQSLSMNSEKHLKVVEVKQIDLLSYLKEIRSKGFSIVAAEQTSRSVFLNDFKFPKKTVLLMGAERLGVPPELIRYVDHCVEIPQLGLTRSLNVHVSASLFIYNYAVQHFLPNC